MVLSFGHSVHGKGEGCKASILPACREPVSTLYSPTLSPQFLLLAVVEQKDDLRTIKNDFIVSFSVYFE